MATTTPKLNVKAFAAMLDKGGQIGFKPPPSSSSSGPKTNGNKPAVSPRQNETPKKINPPGVAAPFGRNTLNNRISVLKKTSNANEDATLSKNGETEIKIIAANKKPPIVPRTINSEAVKKPIVSPPASQSPMKNEAPVREQENAVKNDASDVVAKEDKDNLEGIQMKKKLVPINAKTNKRSSKIRPKENPVPPEGILGKAPAKPEKPPIILELKRDTSAPLPPPPDSDSEGELYDDVETDARVSMIKPMDEDEELETEDFYDDVEAEKIKPARKADPLPTLPVLPVSNLPPEPIDTEPDEVYQDVSDEGEEIGEDDDIYETFDEVTEKRLSSLSNVIMTTPESPPIPSDHLSHDSFNGDSGSNLPIISELSGSLETISSTSSKGKDDHEKQRKKEEQAKKKQEEKERKEKERKEKEEKDRLRKEQLEQKKKEKEEEKKKKDEEKRKKEEEKKMKKFFNLKGSESPVKQGTAINSYSGKEESHDLAFIKGELLCIIRLEGNPEGKWLAKNKEGKYGYVEITDVYCDGDGDDVYDEAMSNEIPEESDGEGVTEEVYECVDL